jgi:hypothetical protein
MKKSAWRAGVAAFSLATSLATVAKSNETISYIYDEKGRLTKVVRTGDVNSGWNTSYAHDAADNRTNLSVSNTNTPPPPPPPPPPPTNLPPVANADNVGSMLQCAFRTVNVTSNDTDPENNIPLAVTGAIDGANIFASIIAGNATSIQVESTAVSGIQTVQYIVADSLGATSVGTVTVNVINGTGCGGNNLRAAPPPASPPPPKTGG